MVRRDDAVPLLDRRYLERFHTLDVARHLPDEPDEVVLHFHLHQLGGRPVCQLISPIGKRTPELPITGKSRQQRDL